MMFKTFIHCDLLETLAALPEADIIEVAALLKGLEVSGPFPHFVDTLNQDGYVIEDTLSTSIGSYIARVLNYGGEWLILFKSSMYQRDVKVLALARTATVDLETFIAADERNEQSSMPLATWLSSLSPALRTRIDTLHMTLMGPRIAKEKLMTARHAALDEAKSLFNLSQTGLASYERRCDFLFELLPKELGEDTQLTLRAEFADGSMIEAPNFSGLGKPT